MSLSAPEVLNIALSRLTAKEPGRSAQYAQWFGRHRNRLEALATAIRRQYERSGTLGAHQAELIVAKVLLLLSSRLPDLHKWAQRNDGMLLLLVRSVIQGLSDRAPSAEAQVQVSLYPLELPRTQAERFANNVAAIRIASRGDPPTAEERLALLRYTGNGGLSLERLAREVPAEWVPDSKALVDEWYSPPALCTAVASTVAALAGPDGLRGDALEPSAGIGRFVGAFAARADMQELRWHAVEYSKLSARICSLLYPFADVVNAPFEKWVVENYNAMAGHLALVVTNPPYGKRGANKVIDPDKSYRLDIAYQYSVLRSFDMLRPQGIGVAVVPAGMLSGNTPVHRAFRERLLSRHHLLCAYRLPSDIYPGAKIVTDVSFWRARGGQVSPLQEDEYVVDGRYFQQFPHHVLGVEGKDGRGRLEVQGEFSGLPAPTPRPECVSCSVQPFLRPIVIAPRPEESLSGDYAAAHALGLRVGRYLSLAGSARDSDLAQAQGLHGELVAALDSWLASMRERVGHYSPRQDAQFVKLSNSIVSLANILSVVTADGDLTPEFLRPPNRQISYSGPPTIAAQAEWLYAKSRGLQLQQLADLRNAQGHQESIPDLETALVAQGWCVDWTDQGPTWMPGADYYSGNLWPKLDRARADGSERAQAQCARILEYIGVVTMADAAPTPRDAWLPLHIIRSFAESFTGREVPDLHWYRAVLKPVALDYAALGTLNPDVSNFLGYVNHDMGYFSPQYEKQTDPLTGKEESAEAARDRARLAYVELAQRSFLEWLNGDTARAQSVLEAYARTFRGYVTREYPPDPIPIARWGSAITLKPHQRAGAWRLIHNNGGLLAFGVGVGKTLTGIATIAHLREVGRARRPLVIVPNSIVWKWYREITRALPDYRVAVIGSVRYLGRDGVYRSRLDEPAERVTKWNEFRLGLYDLALCTYSTFTRTSLGEESLRRFIEETPPLLREIGMKAADLQTSLDKLNELDTQRDKLQRRINRMEAELRGENLGATDEDPASDGGFGSENEDEDAGPSGDGEDGL